MSASPTSNIQPEAVSGRNFCVSASGSNSTVKTSVVEAITNPVPYVARRRDTMAM